MPIDWSRSLRISWRHMLVDPATWLDVRPLGAVVSHEITWDGSTQELLSSSLVVDGPLPPWSVVRTWADVTRGGVTERHAVATVLTEPPKESSDGTWVQRAFVGHSPLSDLSGDVESGNYPGIGWTAPTSVSEAIGEICSHMRAPLVPYATSATLSAPPVAAEGDTWLDLLWAVLDAASLSMVVDGMGRVVIVPAPDPWALGATLTLSDTDERGQLEAEVTREDSIWGIPNVVEVVVSGHGSCVRSRVVNDDPSSLTSTVRRGMVRIHRETNPDGLLAGSAQAAVDAYAARRLRELSVVERTWSLGYGWVPVRPGDALRLVHGRIGADEVVVVDSAKLSCDTAASLRLECTSTRSLWEG